MCWTRLYIKAFLFSQLLAIPYPRVISLLVYLGYSPFRAIRRILKMAFDRLGYIGLGDCPAGLEPLAGDKIGKSYSENTRKRPLRGVVTKGSIPKFSNVCWCLNDRPTNQMYLILEAHWLKESSPIISAVYQIYQTTKLHFLHSVTVWQSEL